MKHFITTCIVLFWGIVIAAISYCAGSAISYYFNNDGRDISILFKTILGMLALTGTIGSVMLAILIVCGVHDFYFWIYRKIS